MAKRGEDKTQKRLSADKVRKFERKVATWTVRSKAGGHSKHTSVPLAFVIRELLHLADTLNDAKRTLNRRKIMVNGRARADYRFSVGLFDVLDVVPSKKRYRVVFDRKGRIELREISAKGKLEKLCKVVGKRVVKKKKVQIVTNDGTNLYVEGKDRKIKVGSTIKISLPNRKIIEVYEAKKGNSVYTIAGRHVGVVAKIEGITESTAMKKKLVKLKTDKGEFLTVEKNIFVVGGKKPWLEL